MKTRLADLSPSMEQRGLHESERGSFFNAVFHADAYGLDSE
jgi:hypothetical protein